MNLQETWKKLESEKLCLPIPEQMQARSDYKLPLQKLKNVYRVNSWFIVSFVCGFVLLFFVFSEPLVKGGLCLLILIYMLGLAANLSMSKKLELTASWDQSIKSSLEQIYSSVSSHVRYQERIGLFIYPFAGLVGFLMGMAAVSDNFNALIRQKSIILLLLILLLILTPLCFWVTKQLHAKSYGKYLHDIKQLIHELEKPE